MNGFDLLAPRAAWLALLGAPAIAVALVVLARRRRARLARAVGPRLPSLAPDPSPRRRRVRDGLFAAGLGLLIVGTLHPVLGAASGADATRRIDLVVALDVSRSMLATDVAPDRLSRARREIEALARRAGGDRLGLVAFAGEARTIVPLTRDLRSFTELLAGVGIDTVAAGGTDLGAAISGSLALLPADRARAAAIVLVTDGEDLAGRGLAAAETAASRGVRIHALGLGTSLGAKIAVQDEAGASFLLDRSGREVVSSLDETGLDRLTATAGGIHRDAGSTDGALVRLYEDRILSDAAPAPRGATARRRREDRYQIPLALGVLLLLVELGTSDRRRR